MLDYKSSIKNIDLNEVYAGLQIQLLTYLDAVCKEENVMPAGVLYFNLIDPIIKSSKSLTKEEIEEKHFTTVSNSIDKVKARRIIERIKQLSVEVELISKNLR